MWLSLVAPSMTRATGNVLLGEKDGSRIYWAEKAVACTTRSFASAKYKTYPQKCLRWWKIRLDKGMRITFKMCGQENPDNYN